MMPVQRYIAVVLRIFALRDLKVIIFVQILVDRLFAKYVSCCVH